MVSFLKKEDEEKSSGGFMGKGDIIFLLVIAALVGGFWFYSKEIKLRSSAHFEQCAEIYAKTELLSAEECYTSARDLHFINDSLDSIIYTRLSAIDSIRELHRTWFRQGDSLWNAADSNASAKIAAQLSQSEFLNEAQLQSLKKWQASVATDTAAKN